MPCGQLDCLTCREGSSFRNRKQRRKTGVVGRRRASRLYRQFGAPDLATWVFTWPGARSLDLETVAELRRSAHDGVAAFYRHHWGVEVGVHSFLHPCGDKTQGWRPHLHVQVPLLGAVVRDGAIVDYRGLPAFLTRDHLDDMKDVALQVQCRSGVKGKANAHYRYMTDPVKKLHRLSYDGRSFPSWYAGDLPHSLRIGRRTGLLAPRCRVLGIGGWRELVSESGLPAEPNEPEDEVERVRQAVACYCCGERPKVTAVVRADSWSSTYGPVVDGWRAELGSALERSVRQFEEPCPGPEDPPPDEPGHSWDDGEPLPY